MQIPIAVIALLIVAGHSGAILNGFPVTFNMVGGVTYTPDAGSTT